MTTPVSCKRRSIWNGAYFIGELRRSWANGLLYALTFFFGMTVPLMMEVLEISRMEYDFRNYDFHSFFSPILCVCLTMGIAVWAGCSAVRFLFRRTSAYFYHSLPIRREGLLLTKSVTAIIDFAAAFLLNYLICMALLLQMPEIHLMGDVGLMGLSCLCIFLAIYAFVVCLGLLCGTQSFHFVMLAVGGGLLPLYDLAIYWIAEQFTWLLDTEYLTQMDTMKWLSPFIYIPAQFAFEDEKWLSLGAAAVLIFFTLLCALAAVLLYRIRPVEEAETPVVFAPVRGVLKYAVMAPLTLFCGVLFQALGDGTLFWLLFGFICGGLLSFMLMNTLLNRNARAMFRGARWMLVFALCFGVGLLSIGGFYRYQEKHVYAPQQVTSVTVEPTAYWRAEYAMTSPEVIKAACDYLDEYLQEAYAEAGTDTIEIHSAESAAVDSEEQHVYEYAAFRRTCWVNVTLTTALGTSRTWRVDMNRFSALDAVATEFCRAVAEDDAFKAQYLADYAAELEDIRVIGEWEGRKVDIADEVAAALAELEDGLGFDFFQQKIVGDLSNYHYYRTRLPVYAGQTKLLAFLENYWELDDIVYGKFPEEPTKLYGSKYDEAGKLITTVQIEDENNIKSILQASGFSCKTYNSFSCFFLTRLDMTYCFVDENGETIQFIAGQVPDFVPGLFETKK